MWKKTIMVVRANNPNRSTAGWILNNSPLQISLKMMHSQVRGPFDWQITKISAARCLLGVTWANMSHHLLTYMRKCVQVLPFGLLSSSEQNWCPSVFYSSTNIFGLELGNHGRNAEQLTSVNRLWGQYHPVLTRTTQTGFSNKVSPRETLQRTAYPVRISMLCLHHE